MYFTTTVNSVRMIGPELIIDYLKVLPPDPSFTSVTTRTQAGANGTGKSVLPLEGFCTVSRHFNFHLYEPRNRRDLVDKPEQG